MSDATVHVDAWEAAGLLDADTAERLRAAAATERAPARDAPPHRRSAVAELFGPSVTIPEVFGYLGAAFLLGAWSVTIGRAADGGAVNAGILSLVAAVVLTGLGVLLRSGD